MNGPSYTYMLNHIIYTTFGALFSLTTLSFIILTNSIVSAEGVQDSVSVGASINVSAACTLSTSGEDSHVATVTPGRFTENIGTTTISAVCNDASGYALYAIGYTNEDDGNTNLISENSGNIITGTATSGSTSNWSMKLSSVASSNTPTIQNGFASYHAVPSDFMKVASYGAKTGSGSSSSITTTYGVYIAGTQAPDTYVGKVRYALVHPATATAPKAEKCAAKYICYFGNGADAGFGGIANQSASAGATVRLRAPNYKRTGYGFLGWSEKKNPTIGTDTIYGPMEDIKTPDALSTTGMKLYAIWLKASDDNNDGVADYLQDFNTTKCDALDAATITYNNTVTPNNSVFTVTSDTFKALTDRRDGNVYTIARLTDGNCWMLENLRLDETATAADIKAYSQNGVGGSFTKLPPSDSSSTTWNGTTSTNSNFYTSVSGITQYTMPRYMNDNTTSPVGNFTGADTENNYAYGNYYNWNAARATTKALDSGNTTTSICPTNWRLPIGNQSTVNYSFGALSVSMGGAANGAAMSGSTLPTDSNGTPTGAVMSARIRQFPNNVLFSGYRDSMSVGNRGAVGYYWSSTAVSSSSAYRLILGGASVNPGTGSGGKYYGFSVRCVIGV